VAEARIEALNAQFCQENYYKNTPPEENAALQAEQRMLIEEVRLFMVDWETLEQQGEELREEIGASA
jgi:Flp pilus assembly protein TadB